MYAANFFFSRDSGNFLPDDSHFPFETPLGFPPQRGRERLRGGPNSHYKSEKKVGEAAAAEAALVGGGGGGGWIK